MDQFPAYQRLRYHVRGQPRVSIVIPSKNNGKTLRTCITSIVERSTYSNVEIVVVDNGSSEPETLAYLHELADTGTACTIQHDEPFNFSQLCNAGVRRSSGELLLFLNDDTAVLTRDWLERMIGYAQLDHVGAVGAKLLYPQSRKVQHAGVIALGRRGPSHAFLGVAANKPCYFARNVLEVNWIAVTGACLMLDRAKFVQIGGFDEDFPVAYNDIDLCYRLLKAGYFNVNCQAAQVLHYESMSRGSDHVDSEKMRRLRADKNRLDMRHPQFFLRDPYFSLNFDQTSIMFDIAV